MRRRAFPVKAITGHRRLTITRLIGCGLLLFAPLAVRLATVLAGGVLTPSATRVAFDPQSVGRESDVKEITLRNTGDGDLFVELVPKLGSDFLLAENIPPAGQNPNTPILKPNGEPWRLRVQFKPSSPGAKIGSLLFRPLDGSQPLTVELQGTGQESEGPLLFLQPTFLDFGASTVGSPSRLQKLTLTNQGRQPLWVQKLEIQGKQASEFTLVDAEGDFHLASGQSREISVRFTAQGAGSRTASLVITDDAPGNPHQVALSGKGEAARQYRIRPLAPTDAQVSQAQGISAAGQVVGFAEDASGQIQATLWERGIGAKLPLPPNRFSLAYRINNTGQVVGWLEPPGAQQQHAFSWSPARTIDLGTLGGRQSFAYAVNDQGVVVGEADTGGNAARHAFLWSDRNRDGQANPGEMMDLGTLGGAASVAYAVVHRADHDEVVGGSETGKEGESHAFLWVDGDRVDLGTLGGKNSVAFGINAARQLVGRSQITGNTAEHAFLWQNNQMQDMGTLGGQNSTAYSINRWGQVVGDSQTPGGTTRHAFLYQDGAMIDLNDLLPPGSGWELTQATDINDQGQIVGVGRFEGAPRAFQLGVPGLALSPRFVLSFGEVRVGSASILKEIKITNSGTAPLMIQQMEISGDNAGEFRIVEGGGSGVLDEGEGTTIKIQFVPMARGVRRAILSIKTDVSDAPSGVSLEGTGTGPELAISPASLAFQSTTPDRPDAQSLTITNIGTATASLGRAQITGDQAGDFAITAGGQGGMLAPNGKTILTVTFTPRARGPRQASLTFASDAPNSPHVVPLAGVGLFPAIKIEPDHLEFAEQELDTSSSPRTVMVTNTGDAPLSVSASLTGTAAADFLLTGDAAAGKSVVLKPNAALTLTITFRPQAAGARAAVLTLNSNAAGSPHTVGLIGTGMLPPARVTLSKQVDRSSARSGELLDYGLTVANPGRRSLTSLVITDAVPGGTKFVSASDGGTVSNGVVQWNLGTLALGAQRQVHLQVQVGNAAGSVTNTAQVRSAEITSPVLSNQGTPVLVTVTAPPQLQLRKSADRVSVQAGQVINYRITAANLGPGQATKVQILDPLPSGTRLQSASTGGALTDATSATVGWSAGTLAPGKSVTVSLQVLVTGLAAASSAIMNVAQVRSTEITDPVASNQGAPVSVAVVSPPAQAGAPTGWVRTTDGRPFAWNNSQPIPFFVDLGPLGSLGSADAITLVQTAFQRWHDVPTASISFVQTASPVQDITGANVLTFLNSLPPGIAVLFDSDGSILHALGLDPTTVVAFGKPVGSDPASATITSGFVVLNGLFLDGRFNPDDLALADFRGQVVQAIGRVLGLGSSQLNRELILDGIPENNRLIPQMDPVGVPGKGDRLTVEDQAAISALYPSSALAATTGAIRGQVLLPDGVTGLQGINVIARRIGDGMVTAVSTISGMRYKNEIGPAGLNGSRQIALRGAYELAGLPPGTYVISFEQLQPESGGPVPGPLRQPQFLPGGTRYYHLPGVSTPDPNAAGVIPISAGQVVENITLVAGDPSVLPVRDVNEQEPNEAPEQAQTLSPPLRVHGSLQPGDASGAAVPGPPVPGGAPGGGTAAVQDLYRIALAQPTLVTATLSAANAAADLNLYLLSGAQATALRALAVSADPGTPPEAVQVRLPAGVYFLGVGLAYGPGTDYTLQVDSTPAPDVLTPAPPVPQLSNLVLANVTASGADAFFISDQPANTIFYTTNPLIEFSNPTLTTQHHQALTDLAPGTSYRLQTLGTTRGAAGPPATAAGGAPAVAGGPGVGLLPDVLFTTALPALPGGVGQIAAGVAGLIPDPDDPNAAFVVLSFRNVGGGDASAVVISALAAPAGWSFSNPLPMPLGLGFLGRGGAAIILTRLVRSGAPPDSAPILMGSGTYTNARGGQQSFSIGGAVPSLILTKAAEPSSTRPGDVVRFSLTVANVGQAPATGVIIDDPLPTGMSFVDADSGGQLQNNVLSWSNGTVPAGRSVTVSFRARVAGTAANGATLTNVAHVRSSEIPAPAASNQGAPVSVGVIAPPVLQLTKAVDRATVQPSQMLNYTLTVSNSGSGQATKVQITDTIPAGTTFQSISAGGLRDAGNLTWNLDTLAAGAAATVSFQVQAAGTLANGSSISNVAQVRSAEVTTPVASNQGSPVVTTVIASPTLELTKQADRQTADPGDLITYTLNYSNTGPGPATGVQLRDSLPANTVFSTAPGGSFDGSSVVWNLGTLPANASGFRILQVRVDRNAAFGIQIRNTAQIASSEVPNGSLSNVVSVTTMGPPRLTVKKTADVTSVLPGGTINFQITVTNSGGSRATDVQIVDSVPPGTTFQSATAGGFLDARTPSLSVTWSMGTLAAGASTTVSFQVRAAGGMASGSSISNVAQVRSAEITTPVQSNQGTPVSVTVLSPPTLTLAKAVDAATARPGQLLNYTLSASNTSGSPATNVQITDTLPTGLTFQSASGNGLRNGSIVSWNVGSLAAGTSATAKFQAWVDTSARSGSSISNVAQVRSAEIAAPVSSNAVVTTISAPPTLVLTKRANLQTVAPSGTITYTLVAANQGPGQATNVRVTDNFPTGTFYPPDRTAGTIYWDLGTMAAGASFTLTFQVQVNSNAAIGSMISNTAQITSAEVPGGMTSNAVQVPVGLAPNLLPNAQFLQLNGNAKLLPGPILRLTSAATDQKGSAWWTNKLTVATGFETTFDLRMTEPGGVVDSEGKTGGDGLAFVIQNNSATALGLGGGSLGYEGIPNSLAIEFDTWQALSLGDPNGNHISVHTRGVNPNSPDEAYSIGRTTNIPNLKDGAVHRAVIRYTAGALSISVDKGPVLTVNVDLSKALRLDDGRAWVGFTSATGAAYENHDILRWEITAF